MMNTFPYFKSVCLCDGFLILCLLLFFLHMLGGSCTGRMCYSSCGVNAVSLLEKDYMLLDNGFCRFDIRFDDDLHSSDPYMLSSIQ